MGGLLPRRSASALVGACGCCHSGGDGGAGVVWRVRAVSLRSTALPFGEPEVWTFLMLRICMEQEILI